MNFLPPPLLYNHGVPMKPKQIHMWSVWLYLLMATLLLTATNLHCPSLAQIQLALKITHFRQTDQNFQEIYHTIDCPQHGAKQTDHTQTIMGPSCLHWHFYKHTPNYVNSHKTRGNVLTIIMDLSMDNF